MLHGGSGYNQLQLPVLLTVVVFTALVITAIRAYGLLLFMLQVKGLEFNSFSSNLLASGAADGELCIWDVATPSQPSLYPALKVCSCI